MEAIESPGYRATLCERKVAADGSCLYRAIALQEQDYGVTGHARLRSDAVDYTQNDRAYSLTRFI